MSAFVPRPTTKTGVRTFAVFVVAVALLAANCTSGAPDDGAVSTTIEDITLTQVAPDVIVPGSRIELEGDDFFPEFAGFSQLRISGDFGGRPVDVRVRATFESYQLMTVAWAGAEAVGLPAAEGVLTGEAWIESRSELDGLLHTSAPIPVTLTLADALIPRLDGVENLVQHVNDLVIVNGDGLLLGGGEGFTYAVVEGCFRRAEEPGAACLPVGPVEIPVEPFAPHLRDRGLFPFVPAIAGIQPGSFEGSVTLVNRGVGANGGPVAAADVVATSNPLIAPLLTGLSPAAVSLGQYLEISGGGFVGEALATAEDPTLALTTIDIAGTFTERNGDGRAVATTLVPEFVRGRLLRYVVNDEDSFGSALGERGVQGLFVGTAIPTTQYGDDTVEGFPAEVEIEFAPIRQVVWLRFTPLYVESLRHFGLREVDAAIRERVLEVVRRDYAGVNLDVRIERPTDFALFSEVEIGGPDPNGIGLLGYDNTPGKDVGNLRLYDRIGGVNALTQQDGFLGFGGVFVESLFSFSMHPEPFAADQGLGEPSFDALFDPFRPDQNGVPASPADAANLVPTEGTCPTASSARVDQLACAVRTLGSLIGTTVSHEIAHSLGLADPDGSEFHNLGDGEATIMDSGVARTFAERAEIDGAAFGRFCAENYAYLREILPSSEPDPLRARERCP
ncbi:MAG: hypothetical protein AAGA56_06115 [Myxococcota bacterium]